MDTHNNNVTLVNLLELTDTVCNPWYPVRVEVVSWPSGTDKCSYHRRLIPLWQDATYGRLSLEWWDCRSQHI